MVSYRFISPSEVAELYQSGQTPGKDFQIVDVRDDDYVGGHLPGALHAPSEQRTDQSVQDLVQKLDGVPKVIFHCALSQVRGPKAAGIYSTALQSHSATKSGSSNADVTSRISTGEAASAIAKEATRNFSPNPFTELERKTGEQEVLVLKGGFGEWQSLYKNNPKLVEDYDAEMWTQEY